MLLEGVLLPKHSPSKEASTGFSYCVIIILSSNETLLVSRNNTDDTHFRHSYTRGSRSSLPGTGRPRWDWPAPPASTWGSHSSAPWALWWRETRPGPSLRSSWWRSWAEDRQRERELSMWSDSSCAHTRGGWATDAPHVFSYVVRDTHWEIGNFDNCDGWCNCKSLGISEESLSVNK